MSSFVIEGYFKNDESLMKQIFIASMASLIGKIAAFGVFSENPRVRLARNECTCHRLVRGFWAGDVVGSYFSEKETITRFFLSKLVPRRCHVPCSQ